jgi:hypothetical protein
MNHVLPTLHDTHLGCSLAGYGLNALLWLQDALKAEAVAAGKDYGEGATYEDATKTSFADLFKKVRSDSQQSTRNSCLAASAYIYFECPAWYVIMEAPATFLQHDVASYASCPGMCVAT